MQVVNYQKELEKILTGIEKAEKSGRLPYDCGGR